MSEYFRMSFEPTCEDCGEPGEETTCPYAADIYGKDVEVVLCSGCYSARCADI